VPDVVDANEGRERKVEETPKQWEGKTETVPHLLKGILKPVPAQSPIEKAERRLVEIPHEQRRRGLNRSLCQKVDLTHRRADETDGGMLERHVGNDDLQRPARYLDVGPQVRASAGKTQLLMIDDRVLAQKSFARDAFGVDHSMRIGVGELPLQRPALRLGDFLERHEIPVSGSEHRYQRSPVGAAVADIERQDSDGHVAAVRSVAYW
jgi:hypothetical protein